VKQAAKAGDEDFSSSNHVMPPLQLVGMKSEPPVGSSARKEQNTICILPNLCFYGSQLAALLLTL